jgi:hypothetical protein
MRRTRRCRDSKGAYWSGGGATIAMRPDGKRKIQLPSGVMPRNAARTDLARNGHANVSGSLGRSGAMRPCFGIVDERRFVAEAIACVLPRSFEAVLFDKLACSLFLAGDSLASPDAPLASTFGFCIGSFCCANEPACSGDRFSGPSPGGAAFGTAAITGPDVGHARAPGRCVAVRTDHSGRGSRHRLLRNGRRRLSKRRIRRTGSFRHAYRNADRLGRTISVQDGSNRLRQQNCGKRCQYERQRSKRQRSSRHPNLRPLARSRNYRNERNAKPASKRLPPFHSRQAFANLFREPDRILWAFIGIVA